MGLYKFRYFFDAGSGVCLWSANEMARMRYGYPVDLEALMLPEALVSRAEELMRRFDTSVDWNFPSNPSPWSVSECVSFERMAAEFAQSLKSALGEGFEIQDDSKQISSHCQ